MSKIYLEQNDSTLCQRQLLQNQFIHTIKYSRS